jgi:hypothetical protein
MLTQVDMDSLVHYYDLLKVGVLLQPRRDLGHAFAARAPLHIIQDTSVAMQACV